MQMTAFWTNCISEQDSLKFFRHFHQWKNSIIWIGTLRDPPRAGKSLSNQNVLRRRSSPTSGSTRQACSASAWWEPCGPTGWPMPWGRGRVVVKPGWVWPDQQGWAQRPQVYHDGSLCTNNQTPMRPVALCLPCTVLISKWTIWEEVLTSISTGKDADHI